MFETTIRFAADEALGRAADEKRAILEGGSLAVEGAAVSPQQQRSPEPGKDTNISTEVTKRNGHEPGREGVSLARILAAKKMFKRGVGKSRN